MANVINSEAINFYLIETVVFFRAEMFEIVGLQKGTRNFLALKDFHLKQRHSLKESLFGFKKSVLKRILSSSTASIRLATTFGLD